MVGPVAEDAGDAPVELDEAVDRLRAAGAGSEGVGSEPVGSEGLGVTRRTPRAAAARAAEAGALGHRAGQDRSEDLLGDPPAPQHRADQDVSAGAKVVAPDTVDASRTESSVARPWKAPTPPRRQRTRGGPSDPPQVGGAGYSARCPGASVPDNVDESGSTARSEQEDRFESGKISLEHFRPQWCRRAPEFAQPAAGTGTTEAEPAQQPSGQTENECDGKGSEVRGLGSADGRNWKSSRHRCRRRPRGVW